MDKKATIKDVAREAGVSIATVSRVVNGTASVDPNLVTRVDLAVKTLQYTPNNVARSLKTSSTSIIAFLVSNISDPFFITIGRGIEDYIKDYGYNLMVCSVENSQEKELSYLRLLKKKMVDGIILNTTGLNNNAIEELSRHIPMVLSNRRISSSLFKGDFVDNDNFGGIRDLTHHLLSLGHTKIGYINGPEYLSTAKERLKGFISAMEEHGLSVNSEYPYKHTGYFTFQDGYCGAQALMSLPDPPTALVLMSSELALGAMDYFVGHGIRIPEDLSIVCFGDIMNRNLLYVIPTIASTNLIGIGNKMGELLMERIQAKGDMANREICFTTQITYGNSARQLSGRNDENVF